jgi:hypothetical protein
VLVTEASGWYISIGLNSNHVAAQLHTEIPLCFFVAGDVVILIDLNSSKATR